MNMNWMASLIKNTKQNVRFTTRDDKGLYFRRAESLYRTAAVGDSLLVLPFSLIFTKCLKLT